MENKLHCIQFEISNTLLKSADNLLAEVEGVSRQTVLRWLNDGRFEKVKRLDSGHHRIWLELEPSIFLYARVSTSKQKGSIDNQLQILKEKYPNGEPITDIASGFNFERKGFRKILERSLKGLPCIVVATTQDRISRTGFGLIKRIIELHGGEICILEGGDDSENFDTNSLISFITSFINSHYGKRAKKRKKDCDKKN